MLNSGALRDRRVKPPRGHHYYFVHRLLPELFYRDPRRFITAVERGGSDFLRALWDKVGEEVRRSGSSRVPAIGLDCEIRTLEDGTTIVLIILPTPKGVTEAYFAAAVYRSGTRRALLLRGKGIARFITLEYGIKLPAGIPRAVLCEWRTPGMHVNYGDGPEPDLEVFFRRVCDLISADYEV